MIHRIQDLDVYTRIVGEGTPVVMVHGFGVDHRTMTGCMEPVFQARGERWQRIYFDLPGMGRTPGAEWIQNSDDMLGLVLDVIEAVIPAERFLIVGESYGGYLARAVLRASPARVAGVLLICPLVVAEDAQRDLPPQEVLCREQEALRKRSPEERQFLDMFLVDQRVRHCIRFWREMLLGFEGGDHAFQTKIRQDPGAYAFSFDVDDLLEPYRGPTLILAGRQDCLVGYRDPWRLLENYPRATFAVLDRAGHALQIEQAGLFTPLVHEWLDRVHDTERSMDDQESQ
jgi:pimeloyl-ACP methyl ester carboxylesterase